MRRFGLLVAVAASFAVIQVGVAHAAPCGTFTSSATLTSDCDAPLIVGASGITVDLGGHSVVCNLPVNGIIVPATVSSSRVRNGSVVSGTSQCPAEIDVDGDSNEFTSLSVDNAGSHGVDVSGDSNDFIGVSAFNADDGGFVVLGGSGNIISNSSATNNGDDGFEFFLGSDNTLAFSFAASNPDKGIISGANRTTITQNTVVDSAHGIYLSDASSGNSVSFNSVFANTVGIHINPTSFANRVIRNRSQGNTLDMQDDNPFCDANVWLANIFNTRNQSCIH